LEQSGLALLPIPAEAADEAQSAEASAFEATGRSCAPASGADLDSSEPASGVGVGAGEDAKSGPSEKRQQAIFAEICIVRQISHKDQTKTQRKPFSNQANGCQDKIIREKVIGIGTLPSGNASSTKKNHKSGQHQEAHIAKTQ
jgi:hypothetical protein